MTALGAGIGAISLALAAKSKATESSNPKVVQQKTFKMMGVAARTNNAKEATPDGAIGKLWARLAKEHFVDKIPNRADGNVVAVYTGYASDANGDYTYILGARVTKVETIPAGMAIKNVPAGRYAVFTSERGPVQQVVVATWKRVWAAQKSGLGGERAYQTDFEVYDERAQNPADSIVEIHIGIR